MAVRASVGMGGTTREGDNTLYQHTTAVTIQTKTKTVKLKLKLEVEGWERLLHTLLLHTLLLHTLLLHTLLFLLSVTSLLSIQLWFKVFANSSLQTLLQLFAQGQRDPT